MATSLFSSEYIIEENYEDKFSDGCDIVVQQHLAPELFHYEFPPKSRLAELSPDMEPELMTEDHISFASSSTSTANSYFWDHEKSHHTPTSSIDSSFDKSVLDDDWKAADNRTLQFVSDQEAYHYDNTNPYNYPRYSPPIHQQQSFQKRDIEMIAEEEEEEEEEYELVDDGRLSPLQLPSRVDSSSPRPREASCDSTITVTQPAIINAPVSPATFLAVHKRSSASRAFGDVTKPRRANKPALDSFDEADEVHSLSDIAEESSVSSAASSPKEPRVVMMKLMNNGKILAAPDLERAPARLGMTDEDEMESPIESSSVFLPYPEGDNEMTQAALKIQAVWRGYMARKANVGGHLSAQQRVFVQLGRIYDGIQKRNIARLEEKTHRLEQRVYEESRLRMEFEKEMEEMIELYDQQQQILCEQLEEEIELRKSYELKIESALHASQRVDMLQARLKEESKNRINLGHLVSRMLDQVQDMKASQKQQAKEDAESKRVLQKKLDQALAEIQTLKGGPVSSLRTRPAVSPSIVSRKPSEASSVSSKSSRVSSTSSVVTKSTRATSTTSSVTSRLSRTPVTKPATAVKPSTTAIKTTAAKSTVTRTVVKKAAPVTPAVKTTKTATVRPAVAAARTPLSTSRQASTLTSSRPKVSTTTKAAPGQWR